MLQQKWIVGGDQFWRSGEVVFSKRIEIGAVAFLGIVMFRGSTDKGNAPVAMIDNQVAHHRAHAGIGIDRNYMRATLRLGKRNTGECSKARKECAAFVRRASA